MTTPQPPRCTLARFVPNQMDVEEVKREGWSDHGILVVSVDDPRIGWIERHVLTQVAEKLFGRRKHA